MVIHRDLKPANLLIGGVHASKGAIAEVAARYGIVKVADFGLSRVTTLLKTGLGHAPSNSQSGSHMTSVDKVSPILPLPPLPPVAIPCV